MADRPRLVATDLDGTLLGAGGVLSERSQEVLRALEQREVQVVFVTGRPVRWMDDLWQHVGVHGLAICSNGGIVYDVAQHRVITAKTIPREVGLEVASLIRDVAPAATFALERTDGFAKEPSFMPSPEDHLRPELLVGPLSTVFSDDVVKLLALDLAADPVELWRAAEAAVGHLVTTTWSSGGPLIEMSAANVTKAATLAELCQERGIAPHQVVAFGDMPNDIAMLQWAGTSYAMENADPTTKDAATGIAPRHDRDGVAAVLSELFDL